MKYLLCPNFFYGFLLLNQVLLGKSENTRHNAHIILNTENRKEFRYQFLNTLPSKSLVSPVSDKTVTNILRYVHEFNN